MRKSFAIPSVLLACGFAASLLVAQQPTQQKPTEEAKSADPNPIVVSPSGESTDQEKIGRKDGNLFETYRDFYETRSYPVATYPVTRYATNQPSRAHSQLILRDQSTKKLVAVSSQDATEAEREAGRVHLKEIGKAMETLQSSKSSDSDKALARQVLTEELDLKFELDLNDRRQQLKVIEKQLEDLRVQLTARQESKSKLIELRMQLMENETKGLGFPSTWGNPSSMEWRPQVIQSYSVPAAGVPTQVNKVSPVFPVRQ